ncbi:MAG: outer membrane protein assembly factor BamD, partial [Candidatus Omnitrophica bacterium]|nr:outer membrane protein assembly factor BamD [Candidatus Omnitrophota bacterium]
LNPRFDVHKFISGLSCNIFCLDLHWLPHAQGALESASLIRKIKPDAKFGDEVVVEENPLETFGRIAAQTAKQVILQKIKEAEKNIAELKDKEAEANFNTAVFYEKQKAYAAAKIYYETVVTNYPQSRWVKLAQEKIKEMEERLGGKKKIKNVLKEIQREERLKLSQAKKAEKLAKLEQKRKERQERLRLAKEEKKRKKQAGQPANASPIKTEPESQEDTTLTNE